MKPRRFAYHAPEDLEEALGVLAEHAEDAKVLAGGQSLVPMLNFRLASPAHLVDINRIAALHHLDFDEDGLRVGATVRQAHAESAPDLAVSLPILRSALGQIAHPQIRSRGTLCGSVAHADSAAELPAVMVALRAEMVALSLRGERRIPADSFFEFHLGTALSPDELLAEVRLPPPPLPGAGVFVEVARRVGDFALVGAAVQVGFSPDGTVGDLRIVCSGVAPVPALLEEAAVHALGSALEPEVLLGVDQAVRTSIDPPSDVHASGDYRRVVAGTLVRRALAGIAMSRAAAHA